ncbi:hypothetical protein [Actinacidiphila sp. ITFR-21]|uniref:hypothetical protein n=1 Tax=Actinacidiphila sp. ITFR-21 TaxID=3075199 RepID=UPI00288993A6|nr:hypothetical protein [Streptomyces sp. ITFR-21]WNI18247.1 hypothetical protein RLT57_23700 [Streptomyces sp. ITFR-21]
MKSTLVFRQTANPRRTTLAHLPQANGPVGEDGAAPAGDTSVAPEEAAPEIRPLPKRTANPRRTVLTELPKARTIC